MAGRPVKNTEYREIFAGRKLNKILDECEGAVQIRDWYNFFIATAEKERDARLLNNSDIVKQLNKFVDLIEEKTDINTDILDIIIYKELLFRIKDKIGSLERQGRGGTQASKTRKTNKLAPAPKKDDTVYSDWVELNYHPFSVNYQYDYIDGRKIRSRAYQNWLGGFPVALCPDEIDLLMEGVDVHKPVGISIEVICMPQFDCDNFTKSLIDVIYSRVFSEEGLNDNLVWESRIKKIGECRDYSEGVIRYRFYNI